MLTEKQKKKAAQLKKEGYSNHRIAMEIDTDTSYVESFLISSSWMSYVSDDSGSSNYSSSSYSSSDNSSSYSSSSSSDSSSSSSSSFDF